MKRTLQVFLSICLAVAFLPSAGADTIVSSSISANTTWTLAGSPYIVAASVSVSSTATLTIEPGVTVKFDSAKTLTVDGKLLAEGTATNRITFTSSAATPARGAWGSIYFGAGANASLSPGSPTRISSTAEVQIPLPCS